MAHERKLEPVTAVIVRDVKPQRMSDFEEWIKGVNRVVRTFEGYLGVDVIRPGDHSHAEYVIVLRFDEYEHLRAWMGSAVRNEWLKKTEAMVIGEAHVQEAHGFEPWFTLPDHSMKAPDRYKMAVVTVLAVFPPLVAVSTLFSIVLADWHPAVRILLNLILLVPTMTYVIMPWTTRLFRFWLYPEDSTRSGIRSRLK